MVRGFAALLVFLGHLRPFTFHPYGGLASPSALDKVVWAITGFGHQAVMIFFVLSGFFITRSIMFDNRASRFSWPEYVIKRLTRLWIVLLPCLLLTYFWDSVGVSLSDKTFYDGRLFARYNSGPNDLSGGTNLSASTLIENALFLQTILAPIFGSNGPVWSLANEFWYYMMFPLVYIAIVRPRKPFGQAMSLSLFVAVCAFVGQTITLYALIWLGGALSYFIYDRNWLSEWLRTNSCLFISIVALLAALALSKTQYGSDFVRDYLVGAAASLVVLVLSNYEYGSAVYAHLARSFANASYTIYLAHFPFIAFVASVVLRNQQFSNTAMGYTVFAGLGVVTLAYCYGVYWMFERHTGEIRRYCLAKFRRMTGKARTASLP
jgi:peptidoglycan/LPS O-acetylase OafA/YrhL